MNKKNNVIILLLTIVIAILVIFIIIGAVEFKNMKNQINEQKDIIDNLNTKVETNSSTNKNINNNSTTNNSNTNSSNKNETTNNSLNNTTQNANESNKNETTANTTNPENTSSKINTVTINGVSISLPATKEDFLKAGLTWDERYANTDLPAGYTTSGGRFNGTPSGILITVVNTSEITKKIQDCIINHVSFNNPKDKTQNVYFVGGLNYSSTKNDVTTTMSNLGYTNMKETTSGDSTFYKYFLDKSETYKNYIEFNFYKDTIYAVTINVSVQ